ncbi:aromatic ring-hydroxylating oxygenase subunit alpha [Croceicoccus ponticola]|nr:aromatic ring-hydroxylating dioxygenase subunit alpha [Croceicoccus ponticola]
MEVRKKHCWERAEADMWQENSFVAFGGDVSPQPTERATLDREHYCGKATMQKEFDTVWTKAWLIAGIERDLEEPGDFITFDIAHESILITRTEDGGLSAVYNVCQHRGNRLHIQPYGSVARAHTCPYHGWSYGLDGTLLNVPDRDRFSPGVDCAAKSLKSVNVGTSNGLIWVNLAVDPLPLEDFLGSLVGELMPYRLEAMHVVREQTCELDANWKTVIDNFAEVYHVDFIHAQHASFVNCRDARVDLFPYGHTVFRVDGYVVNPRYPVPDEPPPILSGALQALGLDPGDFHGRVDEIRRAAQVQKRKLGARAGFDYSALTDDQVSDIWQYNLFPNTIMTVKPEEVWIMRQRPHPTDPQKCFFDKITLAMPVRQSDDETSLVLIGDVEAAKAMKSGQRPEREVFTQADVTNGSMSMTETVDQDIFYLPYMQAGMNSAGFDEAVLSDDENRIRHFHDWLATWMAGQIPRPS